MCAITYYIFVTSVKNKKYPNTIWQLSTANWRSVEESGKTSPMKVWMVKGNVIMPTEKEAKRHWRQQALLRWEDKRRYKEWLSLKRTFNPIFLTQCLPNFLISNKDPYPHMLLFIKSYWVNTLYWNMGTKQEQRIWILAKKGRWILRTIQSYSRTIVPNFQRLLSTPEQQVRSSRKDLQRKKTKNWSISWHI